MKNSKQSNHQLAIEVIHWWEEHKYDTVDNRGEYNAYDEIPDFVITAKKIIKDWKKGKR
jgi:hypothetical protein